jgi:hypothetical protein
VLVVVLRRLGSKGQRASRYNAFQNNDDAAENDAFTIDDADDDDDDNDEKQLANGLGVRGGATNQGNRSSTGTSRRFKVNIAPSIFLSVDQRLNFRFC